MTASDRDSEAEFVLHARNWTVLAEQSPFWAILSQPGAEESEFDAEGFFRSGHDFGDWVARYLKDFDLVPGQGRALDFGCGFGRLTQMLPRWFAAVDGVDIALPMIEGARRYNQHGELCRYHHNERLDLQMFADGSFDFIITVLVLQHMRPEFMRVYLREFLRILRPGGLAFFQLPVAAIIPSPGPTGAEPPIVPTPGPRRVDLRLQVRPASITTQSRVLRDVQVVVHNDSDAALAPVEVTGRFVDRTNGAELAGTSTRATTATAIPPHGSSIAVLPLQSPTEVGEFYFAVAASCSDASIELRTTAPPTPVHVASFDIAASNADPKTAWRATPLDLDSTTTVGVMGVYALPLEAVVRIVEEGGGRVIRADEDDWAGPHFVSCHFTVGKPGV